MRFIGYWSKQLMAAEFDELLSCMHYYKDGEYCEEGECFVKASVSRGASVRSYYICPTDTSAKEGYRPFSSIEEANAFIEKMLVFQSSAIDLRNMGACCAFMEDTYAKVEAINPADFT